MSAVLGEMDVLDSTGHTKTTWDPDKPEEVKMAKETFDKLRTKGYQAFRVKRGGEEGEKMKEFDAEAGAMILMIPAIHAG